MPGHAADDANRGDPTGPAWRRWALLASMVLASTTATLLAVEGFLRARSGDFFGSPARRYQGVALEVLASAFPAAYDPLLGYVPRAGAGPQENPWGTRVTIDDSGLRSNGRSGELAGRPILAVGDSFTFGDEVNDDETWPAYLERELGRPVRNGGVFGYGLDQIVLRAERLVEGIDTDLLIVSVIGDTIVRCRYAYRFAAKPYFELVDGSLVLRNVPVPPPGTILGGESSLERLARKSHLADLVMRRIDPDRWLIPAAVRVHTDEIAVSQRLIDRLRRLSFDRGLRILLVAQWAPGRDNVHATALGEYASRAGTDVLLIEPALTKLLASLPSRDLGRWFKQDPLDPSQTGHMTAEGNEVVARLIARKLREMSVAGGPGPASRKP